MTAQPATTIDQDLLDAAMNPRPASLERTFFGETITATYWACILERGLGKRVFDPTRDSKDRKRIAIKISIKPLRGDYTIDQETIESETDWRRYTLPSLKKLNLDLSTLRNRWVQVKRTPTGETYENKHGEVKDRTAIVFVEVYPDEAACRAASDEFWSTRQRDTSSTDDTPTPQPETAQPTTNQAERKFVLDNLPMIWQACGQDKDKFLSMLATNPMFARYFDANSPEVQAILSPNMQY